MANAALLLVAVLGISFFGVGESLQLFGYTVGKCRDDLPLADNLDPDRYLGSYWYTAYFSKGSERVDCGRDLVQFTAQDADGRMHMVGEFAARPADGSGHEFNVTVETRTAHPADWLVYFPNDPVPYQWTIIGTDHTRYGVIYLCRATNWPFLVEASWYIITRKGLHNEPLEADALAMAHKHLEDAGLGADSVYLLPQKPCMD